MFLKSLFFEWQYLTRQASFYVTLLIFFLLPFLAAASDSVQIGGGGNIYYNSAFVIAQTMLILGVFGLFLLVNFVGGTATRNHTTKMSELIYTRPISPLQYKLGRFFGAYLVTLTVFVAVPLGTLLGSSMPWLDQERIGPVNISFYLTIFAYIIVPGFLALGMIFYAIALRLRSMMATYLVALGLFIVWAVSTTIIEEREYRELAALYDPFALVVYDELSRYWTVYDKNISVVSLEGLLLQNRLLWLAIGGIFLVAVGGLHKMQWQSGSKKLKPSKASLIPAPTGNRINISANGGKQWNKFVTRLGFEMRQVLFSPALLVLLLFTIFNLSSVYFVPQGSLYGTPNWPLTQYMVSAITDNFSLMMIIVITFYSGEIVWRERDSGLGDIVDSTPAFNLIFWASKILSLWAVIALLYVVGMAFTILFQLLQGYTQLQLGVYFIELFYISYLPWCLLGVLAFFIQTLSPNKYVGMLLFVAYFIASLVFQELGIEHNMFSYADAPAVPYSDLNGFGWFLEGFSWYMVYWSALALALSTLGYALWQRGPEAKLKERIKMIRYQLGSGGKIVLAASLLVFLITGGYIHYNTTVLNNFVGGDEALDIRAEYERTFSEFEDANIPMITKVNANVDIFPYQRKIEASAALEIVNQGDTPIEKVLISIPQHTQQWELEFENITVSDPIENMRSAWLEFDIPIAPGEAREGIISVVRAHDGFKDRGFDYTLAENGTFINNGELFPAFGVDLSQFIVDRHERRKRDLPTRARAPKLEDESRYNEHAFGRGLGFIDFEATISTAGDQFAIAPGYLQKEWQDNGRNYYHYKMDAPILNFFAVLSARHTVKKEEYKGVNIEVYYHPDHHWNVDIMIQGVKDSLDYFTENFGPYQHRQMRIIEFPGYRSFAQSFANTVPYSERIGFTANLTDPDDIDYVYYVTAHEVAHQWWGHQVGEANVQGDSIISETLSQYSALMVLLERYGMEKMRQFIKYELDSYLIGRGGEVLEEMPLMRSERQAYIHYRKGSVVMMALLDRLGETRLNSALKQMVDKFKFSNDPYPTTLDLQAALNSVATQEEQSFIANLFEQITLYDLKAVNASVDTLDDGSHEISLELEAKQFIADGKGKETEQDLEEWVDVVLFSGNPNKASSDVKILYQQKHKLVSGTNLVSINVTEMPDFAGIDPFVTFIDRDTNDNLLRL